MVWPLWSRVWILASRAPPSTFLNGGSVPVKLQVRSRAFVLQTVQWLPFSLKVKAKIPETPCKSLLIVLGKFQGCGAPVAAGRLTHDPVKEKTRRNLRGLVGLRQGSASGNVSKPRTGQGNLEGLRVEPSAPGRVCQGRPGEGQAEAGKASECGSRTERPPATGRGSRPQGEGPSHWAGHPVSVKSRNGSHRQSRDEEAGRAPRFPPTYLSTWQAQEQEMT